jgi:hypothetical protein
MTLIEHHNFLFRDFFFSNCCVLSKLGAEIQHTLCLQIILHTLDMAKNSKKPLDILRKGLDTLKNAQIDLVLHAENQLQAVLDDLKSTGGLQSANRMDIEDLLNPTDESTIIDDATDAEIYQAVMDLRNAQEQALINGGNDDADDDYSPEPIPTCCEVLVAVSFVKKYIDLNSDPLARKLDALLN